MSELALREAVISDPWTALVFHVLAHVPASGAPADLFSAEYAQYVADAAGPAASRPLDEGVAALASSVRSHEAWVLLQHVAWLFDGLATAQVTALIDLAALAGAAGVRMASLRALGPVLPAAELLRASALLEALVHASLPAPAWDRAALAAELARACAIAPRLATSSVHVVPALTFHGRVFGGTVWIGAPVERFRVSVAHAALQAAHEATVLEVNEAAAGGGMPLAERAGEAVAVVVLAERAAAQGRSGEHAVWAARFGLRAEHFARERLPPSSAALAGRLLGM